MEKTVPPFIVPSDPKQVDVPSLPVSVENENRASHSMAQSQPKEGMNRAGQAMLIIVVLLSVSGIGMFLLYKTHEEHAGKC